MGGDGRGRTPNDKRLSPIGILLTCYLKRTHKNYKRLAQAMGLGKGGDQALGRLFRGKGRTFRTIRLDALIQALGMDDADIVTLREYVAQYGFEFAEATPASFATSVALSADAPTHSPASLAAAPQTHAWQHVEQYQGTEEDLIRLLQHGDADYVARRAQTVYTQLAQPERLPGTLQKEWLLRFGKLFEQAQEEAGLWHGDRIGRSLRAIKRLQTDMSRLDESPSRWLDFPYEESMLLARKAMLFRELYRDEGAVSQRYLQMSDMFYDDALQSLTENRSRMSQLSDFERYYRLPALDLTLRCQRLHNDAVRGDPSWARRLDALARTIGPDHAPVNDLRRAMILYFKAMGYKRLAWSYRLLPNGQRNAIEQARLADRALAEFMASPFQFAAWQAANSHAFEMPDGERAEDTQQSLISQRQGDLLMTVSTLEAQVWLNPDAVKSEIKRLHGEANTLYHSLVAKLSNTAMFAKDVEDI